MHHRLAAAGILISLASCADTPQVDCVAINLYEVSAFEGRWLHEVSLVPTDAAVSTREVDPLEVRWRVIESSPEPLLVASSDAEDVIAFYVRPYMIDLDGRLDTCNRSIQSVESPEEANAVAVDFSLDQLASPARLPVVSLQQPEPFPLLLDAPSGGLEPLAPRASTEEIQLFASYLIEDEDGGFHRVTVEHRFTRLGG
ncbi:MAG: hypothetical protein AAF411_03325 [Myxococcota bacterium]